MVNNVSFVVHTTKTVLYGKTDKKSVVSTTAHFLVVILQIIAMAYPMTNEYNNIWNNAIQTMPAS